MIINFEERKKKCKTQHNSFQHLNEEQKHYVVGALTALLRKAGKDYGLFSGDVTARYSNMVSDISRVLGPARTATIVQDIVNSAIEDCR